MNVLTQFFKLSTLSIGVFLFYIPSWAAGSAKPTVIEQLVPFALIFSVFYFLIIRPQSKKHKKQLDFLAQLKKGDKVITSAGVLGSIEGLNKGVVTLETAPQVKIKILKSHIQSLQDTVLNKKVEAELIKNK
ncbi:MAG: preprotein translocase subunit YajC [Bdellovibrionaceae bacterium]|nr:preprotein translocase subunit YajC [Pseudobdellovibrionaceae bacterium]